MTDLRKAAEQALEALESKYIVNCGAWRLQQDQAAEALRQALDDRPPVKSYCGGKPNYCTPEQEPLGGEWVPCVKLPVIVHVRNQRDGETHISTREGITPVLPDDLIMRGVAGEEYPIGRELFERTYTFDVDAVNMTQERVDETAKCKHEPVANEVQLNIIRWWPEGFADRLEHVWKDLVGFIPNYKLYDLKRMLAEYGFTMKLYEGDAPPKRDSSSWVGLTDEEMRALKQKAVDD